jgi:hypothetical protein
MRFYEYMVYAHVTSVECGSSLTLRRPLLARTSPSNSLALSCPSVSLCYEPISLLPGAYSLNPLLLICLTCLVGSLQRVRKREPSAPSAALQGHRGRCLSSPSLALRSCCLDDSFFAQGACLNTSSLSPLSLTSIFRISFPLSMPRWQTTSSRAYATCVHCPFCPPISWLRLCVFSLASEFSL